MLQRLLYGLLAFATLHQSCLQAWDRRSSAPYISGDTFRTASTFSYDELSKDFDPGMVKFSDSIFVKADFIDEFFAAVHPKIENPYVIVTHNSDCAVVPAFEKYMEDGKVLAWYGQNVETRHPKIHPIPIGIANRCWPHGNIEVVAAVQNRIEGCEKEHLLYLNINVANCFAERFEVYNLFKNQPYCFAALPRDYENYLVDLAHSIFVLSPRGNGLDCHRTWEALLMGAIPIVKTSCLDPMFKDLPVVIVADWHDINEEFLQEKFEEMRMQFYDYSKIYSEYWLERISEAN